MDKVLAGDIDGAMAQTEALAPGTLEAHPSLLFRLHCQTFLELVRSRTCRCARVLPATGCSGGESEKAARQSLSARGNPAE